jgi:sigma-E factor negative regulatory protein RseB
MAMQRPFARPVRRWACALGALCGLWVSVAHAQLAGSGAAPWPSASDGLHDARAWLARSHEAAARRNYQGVLVMSAGGQVSSSRVAHFVEGNLQAERIDALDGEARGMLRLNDVVHTLWPRAHVAVVEQRDVRASFPSLFSGSERRVLDWYELKPVGVDRVAGFDADVVLLKARDGWRFSQRLWAERQSGLLLRIDTLGSNGQVLESSAFSELQMDVKPQVDAVQQALRRLDGYRVIRPAVLPASLEGDGWQVVNLPAGFREVQCARRTLGPPGDPRAPVVLQTIFSDGLTHVSLFIEPFQLDRHQAQTSAALGATHTLMVQRDRQWITVMGDVPFETLQRFVEALVRRR